MATWSRFNKATWSRFDMASPSSSYLSLKALVLGTWFLSTVVGSQYHLESLAEDYTPPEVHPPTRDYLAVPGDYSEPLVHQITPTSDSIITVVDGDTSPGQNTPSSDYGHKISIDAMPPWSEVHPSTPDSIPIVEKHQSAYLHLDEPNATVNSRTPDRTSLDGIHFNQNVPDIVSVYIHASKYPVGVPILQVLVECSCSNDTKISGFMLTPDNALQIAGAGHTTWTCQFLWSTIEKILYTQQFIVYAPPATFSEWSVDTKGFSLLESGGYVHIHDWIQGHYIPPRINIINKV